MVQLTCDQTSFFFFKGGRGERKKYIYKKTLSQSIPVRDIEG